MEGIRTDDVIFGVGIRVRIRVRVRVRIMVRNRVQVRVQVRVGVRDECYRVRVAGLGLQG